MNTQTLTLTDFLLARIAEDEAVSARYHQLLCQRIQYDPDVPPGRCTCAHPQRIAADCEAKRRIVELHFPYRRIYGVGCAVCLLPTHLAPDAPGWPCHTLRILALPYVDHPDYREEWRR